MVNLTVAGIFFIIVLAFVIVFYNQVQEIAAGAISLGQAANAGNSLQINPSNGQSVCDLKITFQPNLVVAGGPSASGLVNLLAGTPAWSITNGATYGWQNCHQYANPLSMSFVPLSWAGSFPSISSVTPNDFVLSGGQNVKFNLSVIAPNGSQRSYTTDIFCTQFCTVARIPSGVTYVPKQYTFTFVITNLPRQTYQVQVVSDLGINGQDAGVPYKQNISP